MITVTLDIDIPDGVAEPAAIAAAAQQGTAARLAQLLGKAPKVTASAAEETSAEAEDAPDTVCGLNLADPVPAGWTPLEALVAVRCLTEPNADGGPPLRLHWSPTEGLPSWEADGMCSFMKHQIGLCWGHFAFLATAEDDDEDDDEPGADR